MPEKAASSTSTATKNIVAGVDYVTINGGEPFDTPKGQIEVAEVFNYVCPACAGFDQVLKEWKTKKPAHVNGITVQDELRPDIQTNAHRNFAAPAWRPSYKP